MASQQVLVPRGALPVGTASFDLMSVARRALSTVTTWRARVQERQDLAALPDRMLEDIGITRSQALAEAAKPFWRA